MIKLTITFLLTLAFSLSLHGAPNYSEMSTQELISIIGYVKKQNKKEFRAELRSRISKMTPKEKKIYNRMKRNK